MGHERRSRRINRMFRPSPGHHQIIMHVYYHHMPCQVMRSSCELRSSLRSLQLCYLEASLLACGHER